MKLKTRYGLLITKETNGEFFHIRAHVVSIGTTADDRRAIDNAEPDYRPVDSQRIRNARQHDHAKLWLHDLCATCQGDRRGNEAPYGHDVVYRNPGDIDLRDCDKMLSTLKTIQRSLDRQREEYGYVKTFGQFLSRVAKAIGADCFVWEKPGSPKHGWSYDDGDYHFADIAYGIEYVDRLAAELAKPATVATA